MTLKPSTTVREAVFELLRAFGTTTLFGNPGFDGAPDVSVFSE